MKPIIKQTHEPACLADFKQDVNRWNEENKNNPDLQEIPLNYETFSQSRDYSTHFAEFRHFLLQEQGFICCYCMQEIGLKNSYIEVLEMKTEHFKPQNEYNSTKENKPDLQLKYANLLAACLGDARKRKLESKNPRHCDSLKLGGELYHIPNPADPDFTVFSESVVYIINEHDERIDLFHVNPDVWKELKGIKEGKHLNLNEQNLAQARFREWKNLCDQHKKEVVDKWELDLANQVIENYSQLHFVTLAEQTIGKFYPFCQMVINLLKDNILLKNPHP